ncbi:hypothetical protein [Bdellovibrio sp. HCB209]|uniref:hypothetical protein n=1 Tax=Bdellovibrio sp. HCB209 TaxID=3394354 RepID=UPI0039B49F8E
MKTYITWILSGVLMIGTSSAFAHNDNKAAEKAHDQHHDEHGHGEHKDHDEEEEKALKISDKAKAHLKIEFSKIDGKGPWTFPLEALVQIKDKTGVYKMHGDAIEFVDVQVKKSDKTSITISSEHLHAGDSVAIRGTKFIRIMESEMTSEPAGHSH